MYREILVNVEAKEKRVAILEDKVLEELYIERVGQESLVGNIYKGRVKTVVPGMGAAFIDLGLGKDGFLHISDVVGPPEDYEEAVAKEYRREAQIGDLVKKGQETLVQVIKAPIGTKGVRLTTYISLPARYLVLMPTEPQLGVSRRIEDESERKRLRKILEELKIPKGMGAIVRTAGQGKQRREFVRDLRYLIKLWRRIEHRSKRSPTPSLIHKELDLVLRVIRDSFTEATDRLIVDWKDEYKKISRFLRLLVPRFESKLRLHQGDIPLFEKYDLEKELVRTFNKKAILKSGGYILIEPTEAMVVIDVNTGRYVGKKRQEETVTKINCEACWAIARQVRLRNIGGIIVIDFIDMAENRNRQKVLNTLKEALKRDRAKVDVLPFSEIGLVELTRQRQGPSLASALYEPCPYCGGSGSVKSAATLSIETLRNIRAQLSQTGKKKVIVLTNPKVASRILNEDRDALNYLMKELRAEIVVKEEASLHPGQIELKDF